ncbi:MAG: hypothetical protein QOJ20_5995 [Mycobacterium sp.]|nr:hypothetical protein [Mycobacterium sp.]
MNSRDGWLRSPRSVVLLLEALVTALVMGAAFVSLRDPRADAVALRGEPMTDAQAAGQVVASAKQIVSLAQLQDATGGYGFVSCKNENEPPYQAAIYMSFRLPQSNSVKYLRDVAASMTAHGWTPAASMGEHFGQKLTKDGVTAIFYRGVNDTDFATMRLYGECRNTADHRNDNPAWTDVTDQLG